jgi:hypothetical protein
MLMRSRFWTLVLVAAMALVALPVRAESASPPPPEPWHWQNPLAHGNTMNAAACPAASTCYAVDSMTAMVSHTSGRWSVRFDPSFGTLFALSCPATTTCFALSSVNPTSDAVFGTHDGGATWTAAATPTFNSLYAVTCSGLQSCYAVGIFGIILAK